MKKLLLGLASIFAFASASQAQRVYPLVEISDIQTVPAANLAACIDTPQHKGDTVRIQGIVTVPGGLAQSASGRQIWVRAINSQGPFNNIGIRSGVATSPTDLLNVQPGDQIEITGVVQEYNGTSVSNPSNDGETQIVPLADGVRLLNSVAAPTATLLDSVGVLNDHQRVNRLPTGEAWEGAFIELQNVTVVSVSNFGTTTPRVSFTVQDAAGAKVEVDDRFLAARLPPSGTFIAPSVGDNFTSLKGIIIHSKNGCQGTSTNNRGYTLNPFDPSHYQHGAQSPSIGNFAKQPAQPCSTSATTIKVTITDDGSIASAALYYSVNQAPPTMVAMTHAAGDTFTADILGQPDGTIVSYYVRATDNQNNVSQVPASASPYFYISRCGGPTIHDIQYTPYANGNSGLTSQPVTGIQGVVVSTVNDLGQVYLQQPGAAEWGGIWLSGGTTLTTLNRGDLVSVDGTVQENRNVTTISVTTSSIISNGNAVTPVTVTPGQVGTYDFAANEKYEGMLLHCNGPLYVVDPNVVTPGSTSNFAEYRLGPDAQDPNTGVVVQVGNQSTTNFSSLNVSYINDQRWAANLHVPPTIVSTGDHFDGGVTGLLYYGFNQLMLLPRDNADMTGFVTEDVASVGDDDGPKGDWFTISPNPLSVNGWLTITPDPAMDPSVFRTTGNSGGCNCQLWRGVYMVVHDPMGGIVKAEWKDADDVALLHMTGFAPGVYTITFSNEKGTFSESHRFVIQ